MGNNKELGQEGEQIAADYLAGKGYQILRKNYRYKRAEVDIIAQLGNMLTFVEVKYRRSNAFGFPEEFVNEKKQELLQSAAENYVEEQRWTGHIRFDIIAITRQGRLDVEHFEDAF